MSSTVSTFPREDIFEVVIACFKVLSEPSRAKILYALQEKELSVGEIAAIAGITESATSHQLTYLKENQFVKARREGTTMYYSISYQHLHNLLQEAEEYADHVKNNIPDHPEK